MRKMRNKVLCVFLMTAGFFLFSVGMASSAGIPAAYLMEDQGEFVGVLFNFDQNYSTQEVNDLFEMSQFVLGLAGDIGVVAFGPNELLGVGLDADSTHAWILANLNFFEAYLYVDATKVPGPAGTGTNLRFDLRLWASGMPPGQYLGALEVLEELVPSSLF